jgi:hypothetical protein
VTTRDSLRLSQGGTSRNLRVEGDSKRIALARELRRLGLKKKPSTLQKLRTPWLQHPLYQTREQMHPLSRYIEEQQNNPH